MRRHLSPLLFTILLSLTLSGAWRKIEAARFSAAQEAVARALQPTELQADFDLMRRALEEAHTGLYRYSTKLELDQAFGAQRAKLNRPLTKTEFLSLLAETLAQIRCGHTAVMPDAELQAALTQTRLFPLRLLIEGRRLMVMLNDTPDDQTIRPGMEISEINGRKASDLLDLLLSKLPADGDIETGKRVRLQWNFAQNYWLLVEQTSEFTVAARDAAGKLVTAKLTGVTDADRAKNQNPVNAGARAATVKFALDESPENLSLRFLKDPEIAQIRVWKFGGRDYPQWIERTFKTLRKKGTKSLILDLRGNRGGWDMYGAMLVAHLTDKPFRYFDHINLKTIKPSFKEHSDWREEREGELREGVIPDPSGGFLATAKLHSGVAEQPPGKYPFLGKTFVLIDGGTFSAAAEACAVIHHLKRATFIGEETGGGYYGDTSGLQAIVTLPHSKARIRLPMYEFWTAVSDGVGARRGTPPDYPVETAAANLLRGVDMQLELALKLAQQALSQEKK